MSNIGNLICEKAKNIMDYIQLNGFSFGYTNLNPAIDDCEQKVCCSSYIAWVLYECGFTNQPECGILNPTEFIQKLSLVDFCEENNFTKITDRSQLEPGDIVFITWGHKQDMGYPVHCFIYVADDEIPSLDGHVRRCKRFDAGSQFKITKIEQPWIEASFDMDYFAFAYRAPEISNEGK